MERDGNRDRSRTKRRNVRGLLAGALILAVLWTLGCGVKSDQRQSVVSRRGIERTKDGRILLTLDTVYGGDDEELRRIVSDYNRQSKEYYVQLADLGRGEEDLDAVWERFQINLMLGNGSDIVDLRAADARMLASSGVLADLYGFRSKEEWQKEYVTNLVEIQESEGCLYSMGPHFNLFTVAANGALVDPEGGWTIQEMTDAFAQNGKGAEAFVSMTGDGAFYTDMAATFELSSFAMDDYIDWERQSADFETEEFYRFLEFCREKEREIPKDLAPSTGFAQGEYLAGFVIINSVADYQIIKELYGGNVAVKGFPTDKGSGVGVQIFNEMGIYAGSPCQEGAWDFLQYYLDNYSDEPFFPTARQKLEENLTASMEKEIVFSADSEEPEVASKGYYCDKDDAFVVYEASKEDVEDLRRIIERADRKRHCNLTVQLIICEELSGAVRGELPLKRVASNIDNRVNLYLKEQEKVHLEVVQGYEEPAQHTESAAQPGETEDGTGGIAGARDWDGSRIVINETEDFYMTEQSYFPHVKEGYFYALCFEIDRSKAQGEMGGRYQYFLYRRSLKTGEETRTALRQSASAGIDGMDILPDGRIMYLVGDADRERQYLVSGDLDGNLLDETLADPVNTYRDNAGYASNWSDIRISEAAGGAYHMLYKGYIPAPADEDGLPYMIETSEIREFFEGKSTGKHLRVKNISSEGRGKYLGMVLREDGFYTLLLLETEGVLRLEKRDPDDWDNSRIVTEFEIPAYANSVFATDEAGSLYVSDEQNLYRYREDTKEFVPILSWEEVGILGRNIREIAVEENSVTVLWESDNRGMVYNVTAIR